jgi:hypothetical protein
MNLCFEVILMIGLPVHAVMTSLSKNEMRPKRLTARMVLTLGNSKWGYFTTSYVISKQRIEKSNTNLNAKEKRKVGKDNKSAGSSSPIPLATYRFSRTADSAAR